MKAHKQTWQLQPAKARFSEFVHRALTEGPQYVTKQGKDAVVVVPTEEFERLRRKKRAGSVLHFFRESPMVGSGIGLERVRDFGRKVKL